MFGITIPSSPQTVASVYALRSPQTMFIMAFAAGCIFLMAVAFGLWFVWYEKKLESHAHAGQVSGKGKQTTPPPTTRHSAACSA